MKYLLLTFILFMLGSCTATIDTFEFSPVISGETVEETTESSQVQKVDVSTSTDVTFGSSLVEIEEISSDSISGDALTTIEYEDCITKIQSITTRKDPLTGALVDALTGAPVSELQKSCSASSSSQEQSCLTRIQNITTRKDPLTGALVDALTGTPVSGLQKNCNK